MYRTFGEDSAGLASAWVRGGTYLLTVGISMVSTETVSTEAVWGVATFLDRLSDGQGTMDCSLWVVDTPQL